MPEKSLNSACINLEMVNIKILDYFVCLFL